MITKPTINLKTAAASFIGAFVMVAPMVGFDFKDWNPTNHADTIRFVIVFLISLAVAFGAVNVQDPESKQTIQELAQKVPGVVQYLERRGKVVPTPTEGK